jgi:hypothetical protein
MAARGGERRYSFAVLLAGDNNLSEEMVWSLQEMKAAARKLAVRKAVEVSAVLDLRGQEPRRYDFERPAQRVSSTLAEEKPAALLERFLAGRSRGARIVVLSGHGSGAAGDFLHDEVPKGALSIPRLGALLAGARIDILGLDGCQMSTAEVAYEVRGSVSHLVASQGPVLVTGWPYRQILEAIADSKDRRRGKVATAIVESYLEFYREYEIAGVSADVAVTDLAKIEAVAEAVRKLARALMGPLSQLAPDGLEELRELGGDGSLENASRSLRDAMVLAHWSAQSYQCDRYVDLHDFATQLSRFAIRAGLNSARDAAARVVEAVESAVVSSGRTGGELQHSHGLSIYFPWSARDFEPQYRKLSFARKTGWADLLEVSFRSTRRARRFQSEHLNGDSLPLPPLRAPESNVLVKDPTSGTRKGAGCRATMKNPPDGYYHPPPSRK